jgi:hypothetical protein
MFDLSSAEKLDFCEDSSPCPLELGLLPNTVREMTLQMTFTTQILSMPNPYVLPHTTSIKFVGIPIPTHLQQYFLLPQLQKLYMDGVICWSSFDSVEERMKDPKRPNAFLDALFFQSVPRLEFLSLCNTPTDDKMLTDLQHCPQFRELKIESCPINEQLITSLIETLTHDGSLPSLKIIHMDSSWPVSLSFSFEDFVKSCIRHRPGMTISGNERVYSL